MLKIQIGIRLLAMGAFLLVSPGTGFSSEMSPNVFGIQTDKNGDMKQEMERDHNQDRGGTDPHQSQPSISPPVNDPEMVIHPDVPPDPDAVVVPPVVDPEMAVDPATRQPMTEEKLEDSILEELQKNPPDEK